MFIFLFACSTPQPVEQCVQACLDAQDFWTTCYDTFEEQNLLPMCYSDVDALGEALAGAGADNQARSDIYRSWSDEGKADFCDSADGIVQNCVHKIEAEFVHLQAEEAITKGESCAQEEEEVSVLSEAMANLDCQGFIDAVLGN